MYDLILYDTSNYVDFPIGGQLTSIRNFLKYIANCQPDFAERVLLVGITTNKTMVGIFQTIEIDGVQFSFLPVLFRDSNLSAVQKSLRVGFLKALFEHTRKIPYHKKAVHYIHTPEAYIAVKGVHPFARTAVFSHGSFFNMVTGFRFFQKNKLVHMLFNQFLVLLIKSADLLFVLDDDSEKQYRKYTQKVCRAENSIVLPDNVPERAVCHEPVRLLFVGRLSKVKRIDGIIAAVKQMNGQVYLTIIGDGEERQILEAMVAEQQIENIVSFLGALPPSEIGRYLRANDILIMNSSIEGKPMTILEAMSYGMPVITTPVGGIPELITEGQNGEFTDGTVTEIIRKLQLICSNYARYSAQSRNMAQKFDYRKVNSVTYQRLTGLLPGHHR